MKTSADNGTIKSLEQIDYDNIQHLDLCLDTSSKQVEHGVDLVLQEVRKYKRQHITDRKIVRIIVLNCLQVWHQDPDMFLVYGRRNGSYRADSRYNPSRIGKIKNVVDAMEQAGYIEHHIVGYGTPGTVGKRSKFRVSRRLVDVFSTAESVSEIDQGAGSIFNDGETIVLKDGRKKPVEYRDNANTRQMRRHLKTINYFLDGHELTLDGAVICSRYHRVFNRSWDQGGRFYCHAVQSLPKSERSRLLINGEPVVELDFSSHHLRLCYHRRGYDAPDGDLYKLQPYGREYRQVIKKIALIGLNVPNFESIARAVGRELGRDMRALRERIRELENISSPREEQVIDIMGETEVLQKQIRFLLGIDDDTIRHIGGLIEKRHELIRDDFFNGQGRDLQFLDSQITERIMLDMVARRIPCYSVHDSYICPVRHEDMLRNTMLDAYREITDFQPIVK